MMTGSSSASNAAAWSGQAEEFNAAREVFFDPILNVLKEARLPPDKLFLVPGNHDLWRDYIADMLPPGLQKPLETDAEVQKWLTRTNAPAPWSRLITDGSEVIRVLMTPSAQTSIGGSADPDQVNGTGRYYSSSRASAFHRGRSSGQDHVPPNFPRTLDVYHGVDAIAAGVRLLR